jgi:tetratricopeptide (TPR) repeat protein
VASPLVQAAALSLAERRLAVVEDRIEAELQLGRHHELIGELMVLTAQHPVRECLRAQLMLALYRDGRQPEALEAYRVGRQALIDDLGLEPGRELQRLHSAILAGDAALDLPAEPAEPAKPEAWLAETIPTPHLLPAAIADFTGHDETLHEIARALALAEDGSRPAAVPVVAITGKGGAGKTTVAVHAAHAASPHFPDGQLYVGLRGANGRPVSPAHVLERFLRALGVPGQAIPEEIEERAELFRDRLSGRRVLVVLDDAANEDQIEPLLPGDAGCAVIVTSRVRLTRLAGAHRVHLGMLDRSHAVSLVVQVVGADRVEAEPVAVQDLIDLCGGLPLALRIAAARLAARPHWTIAQLVLRLSDEGRRLDELRHGGLGIRTSISLAHDGLGSRAQQLFRRLGLVDAPDFAAWVSIPLLDGSPHEAEDLLESLVDIQLLDVERTDGRPPRYRFHDLIRVFARERLAAEESPADRREALRRVAGAWLSLAREAHRREYGGDYTVLHGDAAWALPDSTADELVRQPLDWFETERLALVAAVRQAADADLDEVCWDLAITAVTLFEARSYFDDWRETHELALAATCRGRNRRGEAVMLYSLGALNLYEQRFDDAEVRLVRSLRMFEELDDRHGIGLALRHLAFVHRMRGDFGQALRQYERAVVELRAAADPIGEAHALSNIAAVHIDQRRYVDAEQLLDEALAIARRTGSRRVEAQTLHRLGESYLCRDDLARAGAAFQEVLEVVRAVRDTVGEAYNLHGLGLVRLRLDRFGEAEPILMQAHRLAAQTGERLLAGKIRLALAEVAQATGRLDLASHRVESAHAQFDQLGAAHWRERAAALRANLRQPGLEPSQA